nr:AAA family ATPase [Bradyrhizobium retamae]
MQKDRGRDLRFKYQMLHEIGDSPPKKRWLIKNVVALGETSAWIAPPGGLKSALLAELSFCVAAQRDWHGYKSKNSGGVVYFALERADLVKRRLRAYLVRSSDDIGGIAPIAIVPGMVDLMNAATVKDVVALIRAIEEEGELVYLVVFDTFAKLIAAGGGDENLAKDQGRVFANVQRIKDAVGCHVALIGHTGKDEGRGARGSNALLGDVDVMVTVSGDEIKTATVTKANDMPEGPLFSFKSEIHEFGTDEDGDPITVNIVNGDEVSVQSAPKPSEPKLSTNQRVMYRLLVEAGSGGLATEEWNEFAKENGITTKQRHYEARMALKDKGLVREYAGRWKCSG